MAAVKSAPYHGIKNSARLKRSKQQSEWFVKLLARDYKQHMFIAHAAKIQISLSD